MKIKKYFLLLPLALLCLISSVLADNRTVTYNGRADLFDFGGGTAYTKTDLFSVFENVMPGDTLLQTVTFENHAKDSDYIKLYLRIKPHGTDNAPQIGGNVESMADFLSKLAMKIYNGETVIYEAAADKAATLSDSVLLGKLNKNQTVVLTVELSVPIELGNEYAERVGETDWVLVVEAFDNPITPPSKSGNLTVRKLWKDDGKDRPESVTVHLMKNGKIHKTVEISAKNQWTYTWSGLSKNDDWSAMEVVPEGYEASYRQSGNMVVITNEKTVTTDNPVQPDEPDAPDKPKEPDNPDEPDKPKDSDEHDAPDEPNEPDNPSDDEKDAPNDDKPSDDKPNDGERETDEPSKGEPTDETRTVEKTPVLLTVKKLWNDNDDAKRPDRATVQLYDGENAIEAVYLGEWNDWTYTWENLDPNGDWQAVEVDIPKGYTPYYAKDGSVLTVTNTATLIQTGQNNLPVVILGAFGVCLIAAGILQVVKKRKHEEQ